ncbi:hypothetical protein SprV_0200523700 [Sparganum proliferum]
MALSLLRRRLRISAASTTSSIFARHPTILSLTLLYSAQSQWDEYQRDFDLTNSDGYCRLLYSAQSQWDEYQRDFDLTNSDGYCRLLYSAQSQWDEYQRDFDLTNSDGYCRLTTNYPAYVNVADQSSCTTNAATGGVYVVHVEVPQDDDESDHLGAVPSSAVAASQAESDAQLPSQPLAHSLEKLESMDGGSSRPETNCKVVVAAFSEARSSTHREVGSESILPTRSKPAAEGDSDDKDASEEEEEENKESCKSTSAGNSPSSVPENAIAPSSGLNGGVDIAAVANPIADDDASSHDQHPPVLKETKMSPDAQPTATSPDSSTPVLHYLNVHNIHFSPPLVPPKPGHLRKTRPPIKLSATDARYGSDPEADRIEYIELDPVATCALEYITNLITDTSDPA